MNASEDYHLDGLTQSSSDRSLLNRICRTLVLKRLKFLNTAIEISDPWSNFRVGQGEPIAQIEITDPSFYRVALQSGALGIALAGDYRIANKSTKLLSAHFKRGFVPAGGATYILPRLIGLARTQTLFFGGKTLNSDEMLEWGLVNEIIEDEYLNERTMEMAQKLADGPTNAIAETKKLLIDSDTLSLKQELEREREKNRDSGNSGDAVEGIKAFIEKREPKFE